MEDKIQNQQIGQYVVKAQLGKGSFGTLYKAIKKTQNKAECKKYYAIKTQTINSVKPMLYLEYQIFNKLNADKENNPKSKKGYCFPQVFKYEQDDYISYMVMELLDSTLQDYANKQARNKLSKDCLIRIFYNILRIIQIIHKLGYVHRDIKPSNFMLKLNAQTKQNLSPSSPQLLQLNKYEPIIYPIDLGLCKKYVNPLTNTHISCKQNKKMVGTAIFCSINTHEGKQQSRRDDIQSIIYMTIYLVKKLPWQNNVYKVDIKSNINRNKEYNQIESPKKKVSQKNKLQIYDQIHQIKKATDFQYFLKDPEIIPNSFYQIYRYAKSLNFDELPDYDYLYGLLEKEHYELTRIIFEKQNSLCDWNDLSIKLNKNKYKTNQQNSQESKEKAQQKKEKKIKINFKIPANKLKKKSPQKLLNNIYPNNEKQQKQISKEQIMYTPKENTQQII